MGINLGCKMQGRTKKPKIVLTAVLTAIALWDKDKDKNNGELVGASEPPPWRVSNHTISVRRGAVFPIRV